MKIAVCDKCKTKEDTIDTVIREYTIWWTENNHEKMLEIDLCDKCALEYKKQLNK